MTPLLIQAETCTLYPTAQSKGLLDAQTPFIVPIFQRPYSWGKKEIDKFINDIFIAYWGKNKQTEATQQEPMFIGTMQLSLDNEIIDGQQRLTTILLLLKVLKQIVVTPIPQLENISLDWLYTKVNNGNQQKLLNECLLGDLSKQNQFNPYIQNAYFISQKIEQITNQTMNNEEIESANIDIADFVQFLFNSIYFVVIRTKAGLSKTLQIFDTINNSGMDLDSVDIFKIKMYEYLTTIKQEKEQVFEKISNLYEKIETTNDIEKREVTNMEKVLSVYQHILIARYNLPTTLYTHGTDKFFEELFDTILHTQEHEYFKGNVEGVEISLEYLDTIVEITFLWELKMNYPTIEDEAAMHLIWESTYSRYDILVHIFLSRFHQEKEYQTLLYSFLKQLNKVYFIHSILQDRAVKDIHHFTYTLIGLILNRSFDEIMLHINNCIQQIDQDWMRDKLSENITDKQQKKNLICKLSAILEEDYTNPTLKNRDEISTLLFATSEIDIEHIQAYNDREDRENIWEQWGENINSLGNLMILEQNINRSISNKPYAEKIKQYKDSKFSIVQKQTANYPVWDLKNCEVRKQKEIDKIMKYLMK